jgi:hypothetical protein
MKYFSLKYLKLDLQLFMQSVHITIKFASSHPADGEVYSLKHYALL